MTSALDSNPNLLVPGYWSHAGLKLKQGTWTGWCIDCLGGLKCLLFQRIFFYLNGKGFNCPNTKTNNKIKTLFPHAVGNWPWMAANFFFFFTWKQSASVLNENIHIHPLLHLSALRCSTGREGRKPTFTFNSVRAAVLGAGWVGERRDEAQKAERHEELLTYQMRRIHCCCPPQSTGLSSQRNNCCCCCCCRFAQHSVRSTPPSLPATPARSCTHIHALNKNKL